MTEKIRSFCFTLFLSLALPASVGATNTEIVQAINKTCVPSEGMVLAGIRLGDPRTLVESRLGAATRQRKDDRTQILEYEGLRIRLHASRVQSVLATASKWSTASGIRPGIAASDAGAALGFDLDSVESPHSKSPSHYQVHRCITAQEQMDVEQYLRLELSPDRMIVAVEIFWVAP
jgi:hypothetical protein